MEFDVSITSDGHLVVFHDETVDRMSNGKGNISEMTLEEVKKLDLATKHPLKDKFGPCRIPTVNEFIDECLERGMKMIIDLKTFRSAKKTAEMITDLFNKKPGLYEHALVSSFLPDLLYVIRSQDPRICCSMAWKPEVIGKHLIKKGYVTKSLVSCFNQELKR